MPRKPATVFAILQQRINDVMERARKNQIDSNDLVNGFHEIQKELEKMEVLFPKFKRCEEVLMTEWNLLEEDINDDAFNNLTSDDIIRAKLKTIKKRLEQIDSTVTNIHFPETVETPPEQAQQQVRLKPESRKVSNDWTRLKVEENILVSPAMASLQLSYDVLDIQMKICLLCFAIFPEKVVIKKRPLIYWWIAEGFVTKSKDKTAQEVGEGIFMELIERGLIVPFHHKNKESPIVDRCKIHPWIRRMLITVATRAELFDFNATGEIVDDYGSHRACLALGNKGLSGSSSNNIREDELWTTFNVNEQYLSFKPGLFLKLKNLVILQLGRWQNSTRHHIEVENEGFLDELQAQKHLKYLGLQGISRITVLPSSIVECINLEILNLKACHNLERLPHDIASLRSLTHLDVSECYLLESMPEGLKKLSSLQVLKGFVIGHPGKKPCKLGDLVHLKKLRKLSIHIGGESLLEEGELNKLKEIGNLHVLTISWGKVALPSENGEQLSVETNSSVGGASLSSKTGAQWTRTATLTTKSFSFPPKLEKLDIRYFPWRISPEWLKPSNLENLKKLYIRGGPLDSLVSEPNKKWKVEILRLKYLNNLKIEGSQLLEDFPDLIYFEKVRYLKKLDESRHEIVMDVEWNVGDGREALTKATLIK
ncbi:hypothetical protein F0562_008354 [Nyssa sinensis]|uniref:Rx N-terminal domain-containing protein n=1 Tax=Nyssa sinensis TaxID=561372 RepID=A0A5J5A6E5_9ASTE|nr:hypothetical protein F0562_008354 [Nyssa sinensis]